MRLTRFKSTRLVPVNINRYKINWTQPSRSKLQTIVKAFLYNYWKYHVVVEEFKIPGSRLRCDFLNFNKKIAIEVQGDQHFEFNEFFHSDRTGFKNHIKRDIDKYNWLQQNDFQIIELITEDVNHLSIEYIQQKFGIFIA